MNALVNVIPLNIDIVSLCTHSNSWLDQESVKKVLSGLDPRVSKDAAEAD